MDFVTGFLKTIRGRNVIWVVVNRITKSAHFILIKINFRLIAEIYIHMIVKLRGILSSIVFDKDHRFTSRFWESLQEVLGTNLRLSSAYHL